eukprot:1733308-Prymnesium_polylepis.1
MRRCSVGAAAAGASRATPESPAAAASRFARYPIRIFVDSVLPAPLSPLMMRHWWRWHSSFCGPTTVPAALIAARAPSAIAYRWGGRAPSG